MGSCYRVPLIVSSRILQGLPKVCRLLFAGFGSIKDSFVLGVVVSGFWGLVSGLRVSGLGFGSAVLQY